MISNHNLNIKGLSADPPVDSFHDKHINSKKKKRVYLFEDDQLIEHLIEKEEPDLIEHSLMAMDKRISIVGEIISLSDGRDKIFKIFSGVLKLVKYFITRYYMNYAFSKEALSRIGACSSVTSNARMYLKLFTDWIFFRLALRVYFKQRAGWLKLLTLGRLTGLAFYFTCNIPIWLQITKLVPSINKTWWTKASLWCYIISTICQFILDFKRLKDLTSQIGYIALFSRQPLGKQDKQHENTPHDSRERGDGNTNISMRAPCNTPYSSSQQGSSAMYRYRLALEQHRAKERQHITNFTLGTSSTPDTALKRHLSAINETKQQQLLPRIHEKYDTNHFTDLHSPVYPVQIARKLKVAHRLGPIETEQSQRTIRKNTSKSLHYNSGDTAGSSSPDFVPKPTTSSGSSGNNSPVLPLQDPKYEYEEDNESEDESDEEAHMVGYLMQHRINSRVNLSVLSKQYTPDDTHLYLSRSNKSPYKPSTDDSKQTQDSIEEKSDTMPYNQNPTVTFKSTSSHSSENPGTNVTTNSNETSIPCDGTSVGTPNITSEESLHIPNQESITKGSATRSIPLQYTSYKEAFEDREQIANQAKSRATKLRQDRDALLVNFIKDGGEFASAYACVMDWDWSDLTNGILSINSGCISLYRMWKRYKKSIEEKIKQSRQRKEEELRAKRLEIIALEAAIRKDKVISLPEFKISSLRNVNVLNVNNGGGLTSHIISLHSEQQQQQIHQHTQHPQSS